MERKILKQKLLKFGYKPTTVQKQLQGVVFPTIQKAIILEKEYDIPIHAWQDIKAFMNGSITNSKNNNKVPNKKGGVMKEYLLNKEPKDARFLTVLRKAINKDRIRNGFNIEDIAHELGMSLGTLEQKLKPSVENDFSISEWNHHLRISADFSTLEYFANKHGFELKKLETYNKNKDCTEISCQADKAMIEFGEAFKEVKDALSDKKLTNKEKIKSINEIDEAVRELQQLKQDFEAKEIEE